MADNFIGNSEMDEIYAVFAQESREQLAALEDGLLRMEQGERDADTINGIFRAAHTIKGSAGVVEIIQVERFTHVLENLLDQLRTSEIEASGGLITALLKGCDHIAALLDRVEGGQLAHDPELEAAGAALGEELKSFMAGAAGLPEHAPGEVERSGGGDASTGDCWHVSIRFGRDVMRNGMEPLAFLRYLLNLGEIVHLTTLTDALPEADDMDPESCYLGFEITLRSHARKEQIENVFAFCRDDCDLYILPPHSKVDDFLALIDRLPEETMRLGEILVRSGALTQEELDGGLARQSAADRESAAATDAGLFAPPLGDILVGQKVVQPEIVEAAAVKQKQVAEKKALDARLIRVQADKLDQLIDLVGELVIAGASTNLLALKSGQGSLVEATSILSRLVENIRDSALQLRMVQIGETFTRFNRVVRDVSRELGKEIELVISGAETELDKSVVEKIGDPLMHLVRNAMDHGIEPADVRQARHKPAAGHLSLNAFHDSGSIVIEVSDDGGGLPREKIRAKAVERGLIAPNAQLSDHEIANLIFEPGFSTAEKVTNLSGRGVGMDVVRKNIQALRGTVEVESAEGAGSRFTIRLPLTLAIIDGFLVAVHDASYVIPLDNVVECIELRDDATRGNVLNLRGEALPFIRLREFFAIEGTPPARENVVVISAGGQKAGIVIDHLLGEFQTVIKPLGSLFKHLRGIGGSTILGSGEVALILDVQTLIQIAARSEDKRNHHGTHRAPAAEREA